METNTALRHPMNAKHLLVAGPLVATEAEVGPQLTELRSILRDYIAEHHLELAEELLPLPVATHTAQYRAGFRELSVYTMCDPETGREGFLTRVDALVKD